MGRLVTTMAARWRWALRWSAGVGVRGPAASRRPPPLVPSFFNATPLARNAPPRLRSGPPPVGATGTVDTRGAALSCDGCRALVDPLRASSGAALQPGTRAIGVVVQIRNGGPAIYDSSATGDITIVPSSGAVSPVLATRGPCRTPAEDFDRYITAGEDRVGCVVFSIRKGKSGGRGGALLASCAGGREAGVGAVTGAMRAPVGYRSGVKATAFVLLDH